MPDILRELLPSFQSASLLTCWVVALLVMLEAVVATSAAVPGLLAAIAGGMLAQWGVVAFVDLVWFVAVAAVLGGEASFRLGRRAADGRGAFARSRDARRAAGLLRRRGGSAMILGCVSGPPAAFLAFTAGVTGMPGLRFRLWNVAGAVAYALVLPGAGYVLGGAIGTFGAAVPRVPAFGLAALAMLAVLWVAVRRIRRAIPVLVAAGGSIRAALWRRPAVRAAVGRYPRLSGFLAARFGTERFLGLTATVLAVLFVYVAGAWADSVFDFLGDASVTAADSRVANLLYGMRDPRLVAILGWITDLGGRHGVLPILAGVSAALLILRRFDLLGGLWIAAAGNQLTVTLLKGFFDRPRSLLGYFVETSGSFPSGHAAGAVAVWAMLFYLGWRLRAMPAGVAAVGAVTVAFAIGMSRIYLVEHYLSDVLNGWLVGGLWLILGVAFCEWRRGARVGRGAPGLGRRWIAGVCVAASGSVAVWLALATATPLNAVSDPPFGTVARAADLLTAEGLPRTTETLTGEARQRVNLIVSAPDAEALAAALAAAGWIPAPRPGVGLLAAAVFDGWTGRALPAPLVIPTFWNDRPSGLGFARPHTGATRLHLRVWDSRYRTVGGATVFVGTLTEEEALAWAVGEAEDAGPGALPDGGPDGGPEVGGRLEALAAALRAAGLEAGTVR